MRAQTKNNSYSVILKNIEKDSLKLLKGINIFWLLFAKLLFGISVKKLRSYSFLHGQ